jgi:hypothetical protein
VRPPQLPLPQLAPRRDPRSPLRPLGVPRGKGGKDRQVPATEQIARKLSELAILDGLKPADHLWYTRPGGGRVISRDRPIGDGSFDRWWARCLQDAGVPYRNPHLTRHTFATRFLRDRGRLETLQLILGHESIQTTSDLYGHLDMRDVAVDLGPSGNHPGVKVLVSRDKGADRSRTGVRGFAGLCLTTRPRRRSAGHGSRGLYGIHRSRAGVSCSSCVQARGVWL